MPQSRSEARRRAPPLKAGFSQMHWMRLVSSAKDGDLTNGVGVIDADEAGCRAWSLAEVRQHCTRDDAWMVLKGRVYNITRYLQFHPGSVEEIMRCAGDDATEAFDEVHPWVNAEAMLEPCCVGVLAAPPAAATAAAAAPPVTLHSDEWRSFELLSRTEAGDDCVLLRFGLAEAAQRLGLFPGEHLQVRLGGTDPNVGARGLAVPARAYVRSYTPVSSHKAEGHFELLVRRCNPGALSRLLHVGAHFYFVTRRGLLI